MRHRRWLFIILSLVVCLTFSVFYTGQAQSSSLFSITFIDVGQGDAALLQDPDGFTVLIDGGRPESGPKVVSHIRRANVQQIDVMVATHPDSDHIGGLIDVLEMTDIPVKSVIYNGYPGNTATWTDFVDAVNDEGLSLKTVRYHETISWGQMQVEVLHPAGGLSNPDPNDACLVVMVATGNIKSLFTCDLDSVQENIILSRPLDLDADVLKVAHHGSEYGSSTAFLTAVSPSIAVISVGENSYGHPGKGTLTRLESVGAGVWRTDEDGDITVLTDGQTFTVNAPFQPQKDESVYLPFLASKDNRFQPTPNVTPEPSPTQPAPGKVVITRIFADGVKSDEPDEYVEIQNQGGGVVQLQGWTLRDKANHIYTFPAYSMKAGEACRVYTNEKHPEFCGFSYESRSPIWNNSGDCAYLRDKNGVEVSSFCY